MKKIIKNNLGLVITNSLLIIFEIIGFIIVLKNMGFRIFKFYTQLSNLLGLVSSIVLLIFLFRKKKFNKFLTILKFMATLCLTVTFIVVLTILGPTMGYKEMLFTGGMEFHHLLCPILSIISLIFFEKKLEVDNKVINISFIFTLLYGIIFIILNILKIEEGPYPFLMVYKNSIFESICYAFIIFGGTLSLGFLLRRLKNE